MSNKFWKLWVGEMSKFWVDMRNKVWWTAEICFIDDELDGATGLEHAMAAEREFQAAGYTTNITSDFDPDTDAAFMVIGRPSDVDLWEEAGQIAKKWLGDLDEAGLTLGLDDFWAERLYNPESQRFSSGKPYKRS